jgi:hypothetical protein
VGSATQHARLQRHDPYRSLRGGDEEFDVCLVAGQDQVSGLGDDYEGGVDWVVAIDHAAELAGGSANRLVDSDDIHAPQQAGQAGLAPGAAPAYLTDDHGVSAEVQAFFDGGPQDGQGVSVSSLGCDQGT